MSDLRTGKGVIAHNLKTAVLNKQDPELIKKYAQEAFEAGHELEELGYNKATFTIVADAIVRTGWVPETSQS